jgi:hypothetical protein
MRSLVAAAIVGAFVSLFAALARFGGEPARAQPTGGATCKSFNAGKCCDPAVTRHLPKEAVFSACGESEATFLGEQAGGKSNDSCKYVFRVEGQKAEDTTVQVYAPAMKDVPSQPTDPFFRFKKVGKVFVTDKALTPKTAPLLAASTGLWLPGAGYYVSVNASTRVCTRAEAERLARSLR